MRRQVLVAFGVAVAIVAGIGVVVWAGTQGYIGPHGSARHLLVQAERSIQHSQWSEAQGSLEELIRTYPDAPFTDKALLDLGQVEEQRQQLVEARTTYRLVLERFPKSPRLGQAQTRLGAVNVALLFSSTVADGDVEYDVKTGDTLGKIAAQHHTTTELLKRANSIPGSVIRPHQKLKIPVGRFSIVVDKSQNQLLLTQEDRFFKLYPVATGTDNSTPVGTFTIVNRVPNPVWYKQGAVVPPDSSENILGTRWLGLDKPGYGIHGSVDPTAIGKQVTAGCVRMINADVEEVFAIVPIGTEVTIVD